MTPTTPHRILALDGGGIRGMISVEVLARIEALLRERTGNPELRLCDWFDMIAGTSTGAITAAVLATGHTADEVRRFYEAEAEGLFQPARLRDRAHYRYEAEHMATRLKAVLGEDTTLGSERIRTLLLLVLRNATTDSPWFLTNNRNARFNDRGDPACNLDLPLWRLVRASTAAPTYFEPEVITIGNQTFVFADGGTTGYANPAFKAFLMATMAAYGLSWPTGAEQLLLVSVGTGRRDLKDRDLRPDRMHLLYHARTLPRALLSSVAYQQDLLCRVFGDCLAGDPLDLEVGDLIGAHGPADPKLFTYVRYDVPLTAAGLESIGCGHLDPVRITATDRPGNRAELREVGAALAEARVRAAHFDRFVPVAVR